MDSTSRSERSRHRSSANYHPATDADNDTHIRDTADSDAEDEYKTDTDDEYNDSPAMIKHPRPSKKTSSGRIAPTNRGPGRKSIDVPKCKVSFYILKHHH